MSTSKICAEVKTEDELCRWLGCALPGDSCVYFRGFLMIDIDAAFSRLPEERRLAAQALGRRAQIAHEMGLVSLVQRRVGPGSYLYLVQVRGSPTKVKRVETSQHNLKRNKNA